MSIESIAEQRNSSLQDLTIYHLIAEQAERNPQAIAIAASNRTPLTYSRLQAQINEVIKTLNTMGLGRGNRIAIVLPNGPEMAVAFLGVSACATGVPLNPVYLAAEFDLNFSKLNPQALIVQSGIESPARAVAQAYNMPIIELMPIWEAEAGIFQLTGDAKAPIVSNSFAQPEDVALVLQTSETTSQPKIVALTQSEFCNSANNIKILLELQAGDRCLNAMPLFHIYGLSALLSSLSAGASVVCTPNFDLGKFFEWMEELKPTWYTAVPSMQQAIQTGIENNPKTAAEASLDSIIQILAELETFSQEEPEKFLANAMRFKQTLQQQGGDLSEKQIVSRRLEFSIEDSYQLSPIQQGMLFHSLYAQHSGVDIEQMIFALHENLNVSAFKQAWQRAVERHPVLRTSFHWEGDNEPLQYVHQQVELSLEQQDWCDLSAKEQSERLQDYIQFDRRHGFQLTETPLMRLALFRVSESDYQFIWTFHHILMDGRSFAIVLKEVFAFYDAFCQGQDLQLQQPRCYRDYIQWLQQQDLFPAEGYWRQLLKGFTVPTPLVVDQALRTDNNQEKNSVKEPEIRLSLASTSQLQSLAQQHQLTFNTLVQGAWALLLSRYSGEADVVFGATRACRRSTVAGADLMVGLFINTLPVRVGVSPDMPLLSWLKELRAAWIALRDYEHTPLVKIQGWSDVPSGTSLFNSIVVFENYQLDSKLRSQGGRWENIESRLIEKTNYPLTLLGYAESELLLKISYDQQRFDETTIVRMLGHLKTLLESMAINPWQSLAELPLLTADETHQLLVEWNNTEAEYSQDVCIHQLFEAQVERTPNAIAVVFEDQQMTYQELNCQANQLAHHLKSLGVGTGTFVGVYLDRTLEMIPAVLGILKAGGAYVPLETSFPKARVQWILSSLDVRALVTQQLHLQTFDQLQPQLPTLEHLICLDTTTVGKTAESLQVWRRSHLCQQLEENLPQQSSPTDTAYIIFTSGSTGTPKGVVVRHKPVINLIEWVNKTFNVNPSDRVLFITSLCFDLSVYDIFGLLAAGGSIRVVSSQDVRDPHALLHILCNEPITFWDSAPPALQQLVPFFPKAKFSGGQHSLRLVFMSGDWIPITLTDLVKSTFAGVEVISLGGATEATVWSNFYRIDEIDPTWVSIPYGKPIQNAQYYILDANAKPSPIGVPGELYIGGECLASGYTDLVKTDEKFIPHPFSQVPQARLYRTGDLACFLPDGNIQFLGRIDHQVKIRGFRIELGEIETVLSQHQAVRESVVLAREDEPGNKRLVAYIALQQGEVLDASTVRRFLQTKLPEYMVPSAFIFLETLPLTPNGKVDRRALPTPEPSRPELGAIFVAPQNPLELQMTKIWEEVLGTQPIGVRDNFFELGGHSLLAVRLFTQIEQAFGKNFPLATLFQAPTIEQLANIFHQEEWSAPWRSLVVMQPGGSKPPFFLVHGIGGNVLSYHDLVYYLGADQPVYGLQARGLDGKEAPHNRIEDMAADYIEEILDIQPEGPYFLGGHSFGGAVAFEMARQLHAQGQKVGMLSLFDIPTPEWLKPALFHVWVFQHLRKFLRLELKDKFTYVQKKLSRRFYSNNTSLQLLEKVEKFHRDAYRCYVPQVYSGRAILFRASEQPEEWSNWLQSVRIDPQLGWGKLVAGGLEIQEVPGDHFSILREPNLQFLTEKLKACLDSAQADDSTFNREKLNS